MLATEVLAQTLVRRHNYPKLSIAEIEAARERLSNAFQEAWIAECCRLVDANGSKD